MGWAQGTGYCGKGKGGLMGEKRDYYAVLGVGRDAEGSRIKKAYRKLAKKYHPDTSAGNAQAEEKFREVTEDYEILSDPEKRKLYDRFGPAAFDGSAAADGGPGGHYGQGSPFEDWFRQGGGSESGANLQAEIFISFDEAAFAATKSSVWKRRRGQAQKPNR